jgi:hypothetical protein
LTSAPYADPAWNPTEDFEDFPAYLSWVATLGQGEREDAIRLWCRFDLAAFAIVAFPTRFESEFCSFHLDMFNERKLAYWKRTSPTFDAVAAPRGCAKSTVISYLDVIHGMVYGLEAFVGIVANVDSLADTLVQDIYNTLKNVDSAPEFHALYGPIKVSGSQTSFAAYSPYGLQRGTGVRSYSIRSTVRGHKHAGTRFTQIIVDDGEHPERVRNPANRDADEQHIAKDLGKAGEPGLRLRMAGTILVQDSVLARKCDPMKAGIWEGRIYRSLINWPHEKDGLWETARKIWADLALGGARARRAALEAFYLQNKEQLDAGARVLWEARRPLIDLMVAFWSEPRAFFAEDQNDPKESTDLTFDVDTFQFVHFDGTWIHRDDGTKVPVASCTVRGWWDPIPQGKKDTGRDEAAWAVIAKCPNGGRYLIHSSARRCKPADQWNITISLMLRFKGAIWGYENNSGSLDDNTAWLELLRENGLFGKIRGYQSIGATKDARIAELQPMTRNGFLRFARQDISPKTYDQFRHWPSGQNDDIPDAIERANSLFGDSEIPTVESYNPGKRG